MLPKAAPLIYWMIAVQWIVFAAWKFSMNGNAYYISLGSVYL